MEEHLAIKWSAYEYEHREKSADWYWAFGIITVSLLVAAILFNNVLLALVLFIGALAIILYTRKAPPLVSFEINERGLMINKRLYPWSSLQSFALMSNPTTRIYIQSKKKLVPLIVVPFEPHDYDYIRDFLLDFIEEVDHEDNLTEKILDYLGF